jgi:hypothetical protein
MVCKHRELYSGKLCSTWWKQKKIDPWESFSPVGWAIPTSSLHRWIVEKMSPYGWGYQNYGEMSCLTVWRTLWSILNTRQDLAKWLFLANDLWRYKRVCQEMPPMSEIREHQFTRCDASHEQSPSRTLGCMRDWFHGGRSLSLGTVNTSWWPWTMYPNW